MLQVRACLQISARLPTNLMVDASVYRHACCLSMIAEEVLVRFQSPVHAVRSVRSTLIQASLGSLRERNLIDRYTELLPPQHHELVLRTLAATWLPVEVGMAHYQACEDLGLTEHEQVDIGGDVGRRIQRSALSTLARAGKIAGVTPWLALESIDRMWARLMEGGSVQVIKVAPKDARIEIEGVPLAQFMYFRNAFRGLVLAAAELFSMRAYVRTMHSQCGPQRLEYRLAWA